MKKSLMLLASMMMLGGVPVFAQDEEKIEELRTEIKELKEELKEKETELKDLTGEDEKYIITDDEDFFIKYIEVNEKDDEDLGYYYEFVFEVENKTDKTMNILAEDVTIDDDLVDEKMVFLSEEIEAGAKDQIILKIQSLDEDEKVPELDDDLEMMLKLVNDEDPDLNIDYPVQIELD
ncbi:hypothetical protein [Facklamia miroungae]|uniref:DUF5067 domain-containing protein n=1 Tax=Facklamia miroungae TaxID=120956 RepID=A0A1G7RXH3_9LACT|nr:hypothetical protein [Facklamia miroungae]NKZ29239.1 hypothetical protein [Facklamia miroungae]SDG15468.1 hypothetical protein SAMN05421791_103216 [Facklamia miroungae]